MYPETKEVVSMWIQRKIPGRDSEQIANASTLLQNQQRTRRRSTISKPSNVEGERESPSFKQAVRNPVLEATLDYDSADSVFETKQKKTSTVLVRHREGPMTPIEYIRYRKYDRVRDYSD